MLLTELHITGMEVGRRREERIQEELSLWDEVLQSSVQRIDCCYCRRPHLSKYEPPPPCLWRLCLTLCVIIRRSIVEVMKWGKIVGPYSGNALLHRAELYLAV